MEKKHLLNIHNPKILKAEVVYFTKDYNTEDVLQNSLI